MPTNRGIRLTPEGEQLYLHVRAAMEQLLLAEKEMASGSSLESGTISIGVSETALNCYLLDKLQRFHEKYPGIRLKISGQSTPDALVSVREKIPERRICLVYDPQHPSGTAARSLLQLLQPACSARI